MLEHHHTDAAVRLIVRPYQPQYPCILFPCGFQPVPFISKGHLDARAQILPFRPQQRRVGMVDFIQYLRVEGDFRVVPVAAVHIGKVVGKGGDARGEACRGIAFQHPAKQMEQHDLGFQRLPVVHMEGQHGKFHKLIACPGDARQVTEDGVHMFRIFFIPAGQIVIPSVQDMQNRRFTGRTFRQRVSKKAMQEIRIIGHAVFMPPKQKKE